jgi:hypothetical protein
MAVDEGTGTVRRGAIACLIVPAARRIQGCVAPPSPSRTRGKHRYVFEGSIYDMHSRTAGPTPGLPPRSVSV